MKLECQQSSASSVQQELETELAMLEKEQATREKRMDEVHSKKLLEVTNYNNDLKTEIEKLNVCVLVNCIGVHAFCLFVCLDVCMSVYVCVCGGGLVCVLGSGLGGGGGGGGGHGFKSHYWGGGGGGGVMGSSPTTGR